MALIPVNLRNTISFSVLFGKSQTKWSCSPFPESLRLSFSPDKTFWALLCSVGRLLRDRIRICLSRLPWLLLDWLVFRVSIWPTLITSSDSVLLTPPWGAVWLSGVYPVFCRCRPGVSELCSRQRVFTGLWGSGEELRLLSALPSNSMLAVFSSSIDRDLVLSDCAPEEPCL